jgi:hypothetical protein
MLPALAGCPLLSQRQQVRVAGVASMQALSRSLETRPSRQRDILLRVAVILALAISALLPLLD